MSTWQAHQTAVIDEGALIGCNTKIWHFCHISEGCVIGKNCTLGQNVYVAPDVTIGNDCKIQNNVSLYSGVILEDGVFIGPSVVFTNVRKPRAFINRKDRFEKTIVKLGATIGANATILCGITIGKLAVIGAGSVVAKDVEPYAVIAPRISEQIGWVDKDFTKIVV